MYALIILAYPFASKEACSIQRKQMSAVLFPLVPLYFIDRLYKTVRSFCLERALHELDDR